MTKILAKILLIGALLSANIAWAADTLTIGHIQVNGLQRVELSTFMEYLPVKVGQQLTDAKSSQVIAALYKTGFFDDIKLGRSGADTLVISVKERPTIGSIRLQGNRSVKSKDILEVFKQLGIVQGHFYDPSAIDKAKQGLVNQYEMQGKYNAQVDLEVAPAERNRMDLTLKVNEGKVAKIRQVRIVGNHTFTEKQLLKQIKLTTPSVLTFFTRNDRYTEQKLSADIERLTDFYMDRGYVNFKVTSRNVAISPDKMNVFITLSVEEGDKYYFGGAKIVGENTAVPRSELASLLTIKKGEVFSRQQVVDDNNAIGEYLGNRGYALAQVNAMPDIHEKEKRVDVSFYVVPGKRVYVRKISFSGNKKTADNVLRRELRQYEGGLVSVDNIKRSERNLNMLGYLRDAHADTAPVPGTDDQVDINFKMQEQSAARATVGVGISDTDGFLYNGSFEQPNFLGSGRTFGIGFDNSKLNQNYWLHYYNPYYTQSGIGRGFSAYWTKSSPGNIDLIDYTMNTQGVDVYYNVPMNDYNSLSFGYGGRHLGFKAGGSPPLEVSDFMNAHGRSFNQLMLNAGFSRNTFDRAIFPTRGVSQSIGINASSPLGTHSLNYYKTSYSINMFHPLGQSGKFLLTAGGGAAYGAPYGNNLERLPFFENYFAGGIGTVRGYEGNTLGPRDSKGNPMGGNARVNATVGIIFPNGISDSVRTTAFVDAGNVYNTKKDSRYVNQSSGPVRFSSGVQIEWKTPIAPLVFSLARPINAKKGDQKALFQFSISTGL